MGSEDKRFRKPPPVPELKEYEHLTEKQRMNQGFPYKPWDEELIKDRATARHLCKIYNDCPDSDKPEKARILKELVNPETNVDKILIEPCFHVDYGYNITIGDNSCLNFDCVFLDCAPIKIGKNAMIGPGVHFYAATHPLEGEERLKYELARPINIGDNVWIGGHVSILPGVNIGNNVTLGAGANVTKDVPSNCVVAGNPAKIIRFLEGYNGPVD